MAQAAGLCWWKSKSRAKNAKTAAKGSATVPVALSGVPPDESVREDTPGEDAERGGREARANSKSICTRWPISPGCSITWKKAKG